MNVALHVVPVALAAVGWYGLHRLNRNKAWFRTGEVIFWHVIVLILIFLLWLKWF